MGSHVLGFWRPKGMLVFFLTVFFIISVCPVYAVVNFQISPSDYYVDGNSPTTSLSFVCSPGSDFSDKFQTVIGRRIGQTQEPIIKMTSVGPEFEWGQTNLPQRIPTPQVNKTAMSIKFGLQNPTCQDATYTYYCTVTGNAATATGVIETQDVNITAQTRPRNIAITPSPRRTEYNPGQYVALTCSGSIGNAFENSDQYDSIFQWETRLLGTNSTSWEQFEPTSNITVSGVPTQEANCQYRYSSVLHYTVTSLDVDRQFRCKVSSDDYSANYTITVQDPMTTGPTEQTTADSPESTSPTSPGLEVTSTPCFVFLLTIMTLLQITNKQ